MARPDIFDHFYECQKNLDVTTNDTSRCYSLQRSADNNDTMADIGISHHAKITRRNIVSQTQT